MATTSELAAVAATALTTVLPDEGEDGGGSGGGGRGLGVWRECLMEGGGELVVVGVGG